MRPACEVAIGERVRCSAGVGVVEGVAWSCAVEDFILTVALGPRIKLRVPARDVRRV